MKYFKNANNEIHAFEQDGSQDHRIKNDMIPVTMEEVKLLTTPVLSLDELAKNARAKRDSLLQQSDWTQLPDVPTLTSELWKPYRQALRDITVQPDYPVAITWPTVP